MAPLLASRLPANGGLGWNLAITAANELYAWGRLPVEDKDAKGAEAAPPAAVEAPSALIPVPCASVHAASAFGGRALVASALGELYEAAPLADDVSAPAPAAGPALPWRVSSVPFPLGGVEIVGVAAGDGHALALASSGEVWAWGANDRGQVRGLVVPRVSSPTLVWGPQLMASTLRGAGGGSTAAGARQVSRGPSGRPPQGAAGRASAAADVGGGDRPVRAKSSIDRGVLSGRSVSFRGSAARSVLAGPSLTRIPSGAPPRPESVGHADAEAPAGAAAAGDGDESAGGGLCNRAAPGASAAGAEGARPRAVSRHASASVISADERQFARGGSFRRLDLGGEEGRDPAPAATTTTAAAADAGAGAARDRLAPRPPVGRRSSLGVLGAAASPGGDGGDGALPPPPPGLFRGPDTAGALGSGSDGASGSPRGTDAGASAAPGAGPGGGLPRGAGGNRPAAPVSRMASERNGLGGNVSAASGPDARHPLRPSRASQRHDLLAGAMMGRASAVGAGDGDGRDGHDAARGSWGGGAGAGAGPGPSWHDHSAAAVAAGGRTSGLLTRSGEVLLWGCNAHGQCGLDPGAPGASGASGAGAAAADRIPAPRRLEPARVGPAAGEPPFGGQRVCSLALGDHHGVALTAPSDDAGGGASPGGGAAPGALGGEVWAWGGNGAGQLGSGDRRPQHAPEPVDHETLESGGARCVAAGARHTAVVVEDGQLLCFGANARGQCGAAPAVEEEDDCLLEPELVDLEALLLATGRRGGAEAGWAARGGSDGHGDGAAAELGRAADELREAVAGGKGVVVTALACGRWHTTVAIALRE